MITLRPEPSAAVYFPWRKEYRESMRDDTLPDNNKQSLGLFAYKRRKELIAGPSRVSANLAAEVSFQLDLDEEQSETLVKSLSLFRRSVTLADVTREHFSDRTACLQILCETLERNYGDPEDLCDIVIRTLVDLKGWTPTPTIAGHLKPSESGLAREWAAQRIKEESILLRCLRVYFMKANLALKKARANPKGKKPLDDELLDKMRRTVSDLLRFYVKEPTMRNRVLELLPSSELRAKERVLLERAWFSVLIPWLFDDVVGKELDMNTSFVDSLNDEPFAPFHLARTSERPQSSETDALAIVTVRYLGQLFGTGNLPIPDEYERSALRIFLDAALPLASSVDLLNNNDALDVLCGLAFGPGSEDGCNALWSTPRSDYQFLRQIVLNALMRAREPCYAFLSRSSFGEDAFSEVDSFLKENAHREKFSWFLRETKRSELKVDPTFLRMVSSKAMLDLSTVLFNDDVFYSDDSSVDTMTREHMRWITQASLERRTGRNDVETIQAIDSILIASLAVLSEVVANAGLAMNLVLECSSPPSSAQSLVKNAIINSVWACVDQNPSLSERVLLELLKFCGSFLAAINLAEETILTRSAVGDCALVASRVLRRHRRLSRFDMQTMSDMFDVETSTSALDILALTRQLDAEDAEIIVQLLVFSPSERLSRAAHKALEKCSTPSVYARALVSDANNIAYLFKVMPETSAVLLERIVSFSREEGNPAVLGLLGPQMMPLARKQVLETMRTLDPSVFKFLVHAVRTQTDLAMNFILDREVLSCLDAVLARRDLDMTVEEQSACYLHACELIRILMEDENFRRFWFSTVNPRAMLVSIHEKLLQSFSDVSPLELEARGHLLRILSFSLPTYELHDPTMVRDILLLPNPRAITGFNDWSSVSEYFHGWLVFAVAAVQTLDVQDVVKRLKDDVVIAVLEWLWAASSANTKTEQITSTEHVLVNVLSWLLTASKDLAETPQSEQVVQAVGACVQSLAKQPKLPPFFPKLCACFVLALKRCPPEATKDVRASLFLVACETLVTAFESSGDTKGPLRDAAITLSTECCAMPLEADDSHAFALEEALRLILRRLERSAQEEDESLQRALLLLLLQMSEYHLSLLLRLGLVSVLGTRPELSYLESVNLAIAILTRASPQWRPKVIEGMKSFLVVRDIKIQKVLQQFRSATTKFEVLRLRECAATVRLIRLLKATKYLVQMWVLLRDLVEYGDPDRVFRPSFLEEFAQQWYFERRGQVGMIPKTHMCRFALRVLATTEEEVMLQAQPIELSLTVAESSSFIEQSPGSRVQKRRLSSQDLSPVNSPYRSGQISPRPTGQNALVVSSSISSAQQPLKMNLFLVRVDRCVEDVLQELMLVFNDSSMVNLKQVTVFAFDTEDKKSAESTASSTNTRKQMEPEAPGADLNTLIAALGWVVWTVPCVHQKKSRARLGFSIALAVVQAILFGLKLDELSDKAKGNLKKCFVGVAGAAITPQQHQVRTSSTPQRQQQTPAQSPPSNLANVKASNGLFGKLEDRLREAEEGGLAEQVLAFRRKLSEVLTPKPQITTMRQSSMLSKRLSVA